MNKTIKTIGVLSVATLGAIHIINRMHFSKIVTTEIEQHDYEWRFGKIHYTKVGSGKPILLLHSLECGSSSYEFHRFISNLSKDQEVYAFDLLGYGQSEKVNMTYTNYLYVELLSDFIKNVIGKKVDIITSGDSSSIAILACHNEPELFDQMIFINPQSIYQSNIIPDRKTKLLKLLIDMPIIGTMVYNIRSSKTKIEENFVNCYYYDSNQIIDDDITTFYKNAHNFNYKVKYSYSSYISHYTNMNIIHALKEINNNITIVIADGINDYETILENYKYYNNAIESIILPNKMLMPHMESPDELYKDINPYFTR